MRHRTSLSSELLPGTLEMLILKTLTRGPAHGYAIARHLERVSGDVLRVGESSLYPALQRLLVNDWVQAEWGESELKRRARIYRITPAGRKRLAQEAQGFEGLTMWARLRNKLRFLFRRDRFDRELTEEMDFHREMLELENTRQGLAREAAAAGARRQLGNPT